VRALSPLLVERCRVGPVQAVQGRGFLLGLRTARPAREVSAALLERGLLAGSSADANVVRLMPPLVLEEEHVNRLADALKDIEP
jgi:acetylornithine/succinyldiaminopimelate/putrescine aminotransferase